jgi:hypothetical protein
MDSIATGMITALHAGGTVNIGSNSQMNGNLVVNGGSLIIRFNNDPTTNEIVNPHYETAILTTIVGVLNVTPFGDTVTLFNHADAADNCSFNVDTDGHLNVHPSGGQLTINGVDVLDTATLEVDTDGHLNVSCSGNQVAIAATDDLRVANVTAATSGGAGAVQVVGGVYAGENFVGKSILFTTAVTAPAVQTILTRYQESLNIAATETCSTGTTASFMHCVRLGQVINIRVEKVDVTTGGGDPAALIAVTPRVPVDFTPEGAGTRYMPIQVESTAAHAIGTLSIPELTSGTPGLMVVSYDANPATVFPGAGSINSADINVSFMWIHGA